MRARRLSERFIEEANRIVNDGGTIVRLVRWRIAAEEAAAPTGQGDVGKGGPAHRTPHPKRNRSVPTLKSPLYVAGEHGVIGVLKVREN
jgi:hypothetical protein